VQHSEPALEVVESLWFTYLVYSAILANLALLLENPPRGDEDALGMSGSDVLLFLFLAELLVRMYAHGVAAFWSAPWQKVRETGKWAPQFGPGSGRNWNRFEGELLGDRLSLNLNGKPIFKNKKLDGVPAKGPLKIVPRGPINFANIYVRDLTKR
jgi:hypothetical protein